MRCRLCRCASIGPYQKLGEELAEYRESGALEELADLLEVMEAVVTARGYTWQQLQDAKAEKKAARGGLFPYEET